MARRSSKLTGYQAEALKILKHYAEEANRAMLQAEEWVGGEDMPDADEHLEELVQGLVADTQDLLDLIETME